MPEQFTAALAEVTSHSAHDPSEPQFRTAIVGGYDREEVDAYIARLLIELEESRSKHSPDVAVKRALEQVGDEVADILKRAHATAAEVQENARAEAEERLSRSRREADERLETARRTAGEQLEAARRTFEERINEANVKARAITAQAESRLRELDVDTDRIWAERDRIVADARDLARQLSELADAAAERFPADEEVDEPVAPPADAATRASLNGTGDPGATLVFGAVDAPEPDAAADADEQDEAPDPRGDASGGETESGPA